VSRASFSDVLARIGGLKGGITKLGDAPDHEHKWKSFPKCPFCSAKNCAGVFAKGDAEVLPGALVLSEQRAGPEGGDVGPVAGELLHRLLEAGDGPSRDTEDVEEGVPKRFGSAKTPGPTH